VPIGRGLYDRMAESQQVRGEKSMSTPRKTKNTTARGARVFSVHGALHEGLVENCTFKSRTKKYMDKYSMSNKSRVWRPS